MATLYDIVARTVPPVAWREGANIPWNDPAFSERMLEEHLTDRHDLASRRSDVIDRHVEGIDEWLPAGAASILDLACGPGLYLNRLARGGRRGLGIDFSPASIDHARRTAAAEQLPVRYIEDDIRTATFGTGFDAVLLIYGQLNVFRREEASNILTRAAQALVPGGHVIVEMQTFDAVRAAGHESPTWSANATGLFSDRPHLLLTEAHWDEIESTTTQRFHVIDAQDGTVTTHAMSAVAYGEEELRSVFDGAGVPLVSVRPSLSADDFDTNLTVLVGRRSVDAKI